MNALFKTILFSLLIFTAAQAHADEVRIAAASNFRDAIRAVAHAFEQETGHEAVLIFGSTGKHYAQIVNGAPFDLFFAADSERPARLEKDGFAVPGSRFSYAIGRLALWSADVDRVDSEGRVIAEDGFRRLAMANPDLAPYGRAARQALAALDQWERLKDRLVTGENIAQAFQYVATGNAQLGFVAWSQLQRPGAQPDGSWWLVPASLHDPIEQQAVLLRPGEAAKAFLAFVKGERAVEIIRAHGYSVPDDL